MQIVWPADNQWTTTFIATVDGVHCRFHEVKHPTLSKNPDYYSWKHNGPGLSYELSLHIWESRLIWCKKNDTTKSNDRKNFASPGGIRSRIPAGKKVVTDRAYRGRGGDPKVAPPNAHDSKELRTFKGRARMRQEAFHSRIKRFRCIKDAFRHGEEEHQNCFEAICVLLQYEMELVSPMFDV